MRFLFFPGFGTSDYDYHRFIERLNKLGKVYTHNSWPSNFILETTDLIIAHSYGANLALKFALENQVDAKVKLLLISPKLSPVKLNFKLILNAFVMYLYAKLSTGDFSAFLHLNPFAIKPNNLTTHLSIDLEKVLNPVFAVLTTKDSMISYQEQYEAISKLPNLVESFNFNNNHHIVDTKIPELVTIVEKIIQITS